MGAYASCTNNPSSRVHVWSWRVGAFLDEDRASVPWQLHTKWRPRHQVPLKARPAGPSYQVLIPSNPELVLSELSRFTAYWRQHTVGLTGGRRGAWGDTCARQRHLKPKILIESTRPCIWNSSGERRQLDRIGGAREARRAAGVGGDTRSGPFAWHSGAWIWDLCRAGANP